MSSPRFLIVLLRVYSRIPTLVAIILALGTAACGGSSSEPATATKALSGPGFVFRAPADRAVERTERSVTVRPAAESDPELVSVTRFPLLKRFRPSLWPGVVAELDSRADKLAAALGGEIVASEDVRVGGLRGRRYELAYEQEGEQLRYRITFAFRGREQFQLLCRYADAEAPPETCVLLETTFRTV